MPQTSRFDAPAGPVMPGACTRLYLAAQHDPAAIVQQLVTHGADVNAGSTDAGVGGNTALHAAACRGRLDIVQLLLGAGANINSANNTGSTPLHQAALWGFAPVAKQLLEAGAEQHCATARGDTPLHLAVRMGSHEVMQLLCDAGADVNRANSQGETPLHEAARQRQAVAVQQLTQRGANQNAVNRCGRTPLDEAAAAGNVETVWSLLGQGAALHDAGARKLLRAAARHGHTKDMVQLLRACAADTSSRGVGDTPLHWAARRGDVRALQLLLACGADAKACNDMDQTPSDAASSRCAKNKLWSAEHRRPAKKALLKRRHALDAMLERMRIVATLLATVTFGSWMEPPGGFTHHGKVRLVAGAEGPSFTALRAFFVLDELAFALSLATVMLSTAFSVPSAKPLSSGRVWFVVAFVSACLTVAIACGFGAFVAAGVAVYPGFLATQDVLVPSFSVSLVMLLAVLRWCADMVNVFPGWEALGCAVLPSWVLRWAVVDCEAAEMEEEEAADEHAADEYDDDE